MNTGNELLIILSSAALPLLALFLFLLWLRRRAEEIKKDFIGQWQGRMKILNGCTVVHGMSRVPGLVALTDDRVVFRSVILNFSGEIPLAAIEKVEIKNALRYRYTHKIIPGRKVLEIYFAGGAQRFFIKSPEINAWKNALSSRE